MKRKTLDRFHVQEKALDDWKIINEYFGHTFNNDSPIIEDEENFAYAQEDHFSRFNTVKVAASPELIWNE